MDKRAARFVRAWVLMMLAITTLSRRGHAQARATEPTEIVVTGTRTPEQSQRATVKTDVVTRAEAERRGAVTVADALATQPGVQVNPGAYGYLGKLSPIQIQGFDLNRVLVLEDGEPASPPQQVGASTHARSEYRSHNGVLLDGSAAYRAEHAWAELDLGYNRQDGIAEEPPLPDGASASP